MHGVDGVAAIGIHWITSICYAIGDIWQFVERSITLTGMAAISDEYLKITICLYYRMRMLIRI